MAALTWNAAYCLNYNCNFLSVDRQICRAKICKSEILAVDKINDLITNIFDPNLFFSNFNNVENEQNLVGNKPKKNKALNLNYKTRINVTSILINQLFSTFTNEMNVKKFLKGYDANKKFEKKELTNEGI